ncbi:Kelch repeat-containing protein [Hyalangium minutum]|uniref:High-affinity leucine-specific transport system, periplasmic binding protein LivK n=1 Tax=Hyalangium minutum TaxID=394096 RepID=A0A085WUB2_9BACT|nr:kelch repeat-containing protein [Hyalangium minutum]KFE71275.1 High-affinity leucine-specific transport system, periplasmic binding protein LivK [Hyalangium minutum]
MKTLSRHLFWVLALALLASCSASSPAPGAAQFAVSLPQALSSSDVTRIRVTVSASDMEALSVELAKSNGAWGGLIGNLPAGANRSFLAQAFDSSGALLFQGQTSGVSIAPNQTTAVALTLQQVSAPPPYGNEAPIIDSLVASSTSVLTGGALSLTATVHDPNPGDTLTLNWTASGGSFSAPSALDTSWTAPASAGIQTLILTVTDSQGAAVSVSLAVNVSSASTGNAALNISFNLWPTVSRVSASLSRLDAGQSTTVSVLASDGDGDGLSYQWTSSCPGTWTDASFSTASFVPSSVPAGACNNCQLTVTVQDSRGGQTTGSLALCVASASMERFPPRISHLYQSATSTAPGQTVTFEVTALDPQASSLTFTWSATTGSLGTPVNGASSSHVTWTAPSCASGGMTPGITATVTNAFHLSATQNFRVEGVPACPSGWTSTQAMSLPRYHHTATLLPNGKVLVAGGVFVSAHAMAEVYDPASGTWSATGSMAQGRYIHTATLLPNGKVLVTGGSNGVASLATAEVYDPASGTWSATGPMASPRSEHTATLLPNGKVLIAGGYTNPGTHSSSSLVTAEVYDPASGTWSTAGAMATPRSVHTATLLPNGKVLVTGGSNSDFLATAEVYDPASGTWSTAGAMASPRRYHTAALLPNGKVLIAGGYSSPIFATAEVYDPVSGTWSMTGSMVTPRYLHTVTLLQSGKVLVAGGANGLNHREAEAYDPASGTWSAVPSMIHVRRSHAAALLQDGRVLISGGYNGGGFPDAELYSP